MSRWRSLLPALPVLQVLPVQTKPRRRHPPRTTRSRARLTSLHLFAWMAQEFRTSLKAVQWTSHCPRQRPSSVGSNAPAAERAEASRGRQLPASVTTIMTKTLLSAPPVLSGSVGLSGPLNQRGLHLLGRSGPECISAPSATKTIRAPRRRPRDPAPPRNRAASRAACTRRGLWNTTSPTWWPVYLLCFRDTESLRGGGFNYSSTLTGYIVEFAISRLCTLEPRTVAFTCTLWISGGTE